MFYEDPDHSIWIFLFHRIPWTSFRSLFTLLFHSSLFSSLSGEPSFSFSWFPDLLWAFFQIFPFFCNIPDFFQASKLPCSILPFSSGRFLPFMSLTFPTLWNFPFLWPLSSFFFVALPAYLFSLKSLFIFFGPSFAAWYPLISWPLFTVIVRTFLFRKLIKLVLPTLFLFCSCLILCPLFFISFCAGFLFVLPLLWHISFLFLAPAFSIILLFLSVLTMFHSKQVWSRTVVKVDAATRSTLYLLNTKDQLTSMKLADNNNPKSHLAEVKQHFQLMMEHHDNLIKWALPYLTHATTLSSCHLSQNPIAQPCTPLWPWSMQVQS